MNHVYGKLENVLFFVLHGLERYKSDMFLLQTSDYPACSANRRYLIIINKLRS